ncbi:MAG: hypothetical protein R6X13_07230 [bacterium]
MAHAYTPGLKVTARTLVKKQRRLPLPGETRVQQGQRVKGDDVVAHTDLPGNVTTVNVGGLLGVPPEDVPGMMMKQAGDAISKGEVIALSKGFLGLFKTEVKAPVAGTIESVSHVTGQVIMREPPEPVQVDAYIEGVVSEVLPREGVVVETMASLVQGIFGVGGEVRGVVHMAVQSSDTVLTAKHITPECRGKVVVGGSLVEYSAIEEAVKQGAKALIGGGIEDATLRKFLGYDIGVAITGQEKKGLTVVATEGFGQMNMAQKTFDLLKSLEGKMASVNGATQIRAGVIRPEVIVPLGDDVPEVVGSDAEAGLSLGMLVRIIRQPHFGAIGKVVGLPVDLETIETEAKCRVLEVEVDGVGRVRLPRANVEIIEG